MSAINEILINQRKDYKYKTNDGTEPSAYRSYSSADVCFANFTLNLDGKIYRFGGEDLMYWVLNKDRMVSLEPIVRFAQRKNIINTTVNDTEEVLERWGTTGYEISIDGLLIDMENHKYPQDALKMLRDLFAANKVGVISDAILFNDLGITDVYFTSINIEPLVGHEDTIRYSLQGKSISPYYFELKP